MCTFNAKEFHNAPAKVFREADLGNEVKINHDRYPDKIFVLTAKERGIEFKNGEDKKDD